MDYGQGDLGSVFSIAIIGRDFVFLALALEVDKTSYTIDFEGCCHLFRPVVRVSTHFNLQVQFPK
jgi:hypothetical protein